MVNWKMIRLVKEADRLLLKMFWRKIWDENQGSCL